MKESENLKKFLAIVVFIIFFFVPNVAFATVMYPGILGGELLIVMLGIFIFVFGVLILRVMVVIIQDLCAGKGFKMIFLEMKREIKRERSRVLRRMREKRRGR